MNPPIGFIITSHHMPQQLERLTGRLNILFDHPPVVCHHNFSQCALATERFAENVSFVRPHIQTGWGTFSLVEAIVRAMEQLYASPKNPDWFVLLSGSDYPIKRATRILNDLNTGGFDAYIGHQLIRSGVLQTNWQKKCHRRYCSVNFPSRALSRRLRIRRPVLSLTHPMLTKHFLPFSDSFQCYAGELWFCANRRAVQHIISFHWSNPRLVKHYQRVPLPEESYFPTILANAPELKLNPSCLRYTDWSAGGWHPKMLGVEDLPKLCASEAHFARKFDMDRDADILDELDKVE